MPTGSLDEGARKLLWIQYHGVMPHSRMKTGGEKQGKRSHRRKKFRKNVSFCERGGSSTLGA